MNRTEVFRRTTLTGMAILALVLVRPPVLSAAEESSDMPFLSGEGPGGDVQERGVTPLPPIKGFSDQRVAPNRGQPGGNPPAHLCHTETLMMTQCKCFNQAECQTLTALFPNSCPAGSHHCEFIPMSRGSMPPLPPNLCGYQVPFPVTECSCHNVTECQQLSPYCPGSCPPGSHSCTCRPMQRR